MTEFMKPKKTKHNYTSEIELKSLLIRIKNMRAEIGTLEENNRINRYVRWHTNISRSKYSDAKQKARVRAKLKDKIVSLSEITTADRMSYERFGAIILLMIEKILTKPNFSGYTYHDEFYSDAIHKILKYLHNFNHNLTSERTGQQVNAFAYISQIIHNSVIYVINSKKKESVNFNKLKEIEEAKHEYSITNHEIYVDTHSADRENMKSQDIVLESIEESLLSEIDALKHLLPYVDQLNVYIPHDYIITFEDYNELKEMLKGKVSLMRSK